MSEPTDIQDIFSLTPLQEGMFFHYLIDKSSSAYFEQMIYRIGAELQPRLVSETLNILAERHEALRSNFRRDKTGRALQVIFKNRKIPFFFLDFSDVGPGVAESKISETIEQDRQRTFSLENEPLMRVHLLKRATDDFLFVLTRHHIIFDGWSTNILLEEYDTIYRALSTGTKLQIGPPPSVKDYVQWLQGKSLQSSDYYWRNYLSDYQRVGIPLADFGGEARNKYLLATETSGADEKITAGIRRIGHAHQCSLNTVLTAVWGIVLGYFTNSRDVVFGKVVSGRPPHIGGVDRMVGLFINTIPVRVRFALDTTFSEILTKQNEDWLEGLDHHYMPLSDVQQYSNARQELIDHTLIFEDVTGTTELDQNNKGLAENVDAFEQSNYNLDVRIKSDRRIELVAKYNAAALRAPWIKSFLNRIVYALDRIVAKPESTIFDILQPSIADIEFYRKFNDTVVEYPSGSTMPQVLADISNQFPAKIAYIDEYGSFTFEKVVQWSRAITDYLVRTGKGEQTRVAFLMERGNRMASAILGVWQSGSVYVPLDPDVSDERLAFIVNDAGVGVIFTSKEHLEKARRLQWNAHVVPQVVCLDGRLEDTVIRPNRSMDRELWEMIGDRGVTVIEQGGWFNSYDGNPFSSAEMDEYAKNTRSKLQRYLRSTSRVLEIGCGSGITLAEIRSSIGSYVGVDMSRTVIARNRHRWGNHANIRFEVMEAHEIGAIQENFDVVILNSVIQNFPGYSYLEKVLYESWKLLMNGGVIFLGDLMDGEKKSSLIEDLKAFRVSPRGTSRTKTDWSNEFFVTRRYLQSLESTFEGSKISFSDKIGNISNELSRFRFDAVLELPAFNTQLKRKPATLVDEAELDGCDTSNYCRTKDLAYIIYTSGSSGTPKGVMVEHAGMMNHVYAKINDLDIHAGSHIAQNASQCFDISIWQMFAALPRAGTVTFYSNDVIMDVPRFYARTVTDQVNILELVPTYLSSILEADELMQPRLFDHLEYLLLTGETFPKALAGKLLRRSGERLKVVNAYGPTEASDDITHFIFSTLPEGAAIPVGKPVQNLKIHLLQERRLLCSPMVPGEIVVSGVGVGRGYVNDEEETSKVFVDDLFGSGRTYYTGDLGRIGYDGNIEFFGRVDSQIKINGFRIEIGEIEIQLLKIELVLEAAVVCDPSSSTLLAFITLSVDEYNDAGAEVRNRLDKLLPHYMIPSNIVVLPRLPLNSNGKIDRRALLTQMPGESASRSPLSEGLETTVADIWKEVLGGVQVFADSNFFNIGGHSLKATQVVSRLAHRTGIKVELKYLFSHPTLRAFVQAIQQYSQKSLVRITRAPEAPHYKLSSSQLRMWFVDQLEEGGNSACNVPEIYFFRGEVNLVYLQRAFVRVIERHEILRTNFIEVDGEPVQVIKPKDAFEFHINVLDVSREAEPVESAKEIADQEAHLPFDISHEMPIRVTSIKLADREFVFCYTLHHIVGDGWSMQLLRKEIQILYESLLNNVPAILPSLEIQYKDYSHWQLSQNYSKAERYWMTKLKDISFVSLPYDRPELHNNKFQGGNLSVRMSDDVTDSLFDLAVRYETTISTMIMAAFQIFLFNLTGQKNLFIGVANANRPLKELENLIGFFINVIIVKSELKDDLDFGEHVRAVGSEMVTSLEHQDYPFELLVQKLNPERIANNQPLFNVGYGFQNFSDVITESDALNLHSATDYSLKGGQAKALFKQEFNTSKYDLTLFVYQAGKSLVIRFEYNSQFFYEETIRTWLRDFRGILETIAVRKSEVTPQHKIVAS